MSVHKYKYKSEKFQLKLKKELRKRYGFLFCGAWKKGKEVLVYNWRNTEFSPSHFEKLKDYTRIW